jgi:hypothetical protein
VGESVSKWERVYKNGKYIKKIMIGYKRIINDNGVVSIETFIAKSHPHTLRKQFFAIRENIAIRE